MNIEQQKHLTVGDRLIAAADMTKSEEFDSWLETVGPHVQIVKIGMALATSPEIGEQEAVRRILTRFPGKRLMIDRKLYEIPANMVLAMKNILRLGGVWGVTVHASATAEAIRAIGKVKGDALVIGVTVLTTMTETQCMRIYGSAVEETVLRLADEAREGGVDAIVCSPSEIGLLRQHERFDQIEIITPNVRPEWAVIPGDDQNANRQMTPGVAINAGASRIVMGRPLVGTFAKASGPAETVPLILTEMLNAIAVRDGVA